MDKPRLNAVDSGQFYEIARVDHLLDDPAEETRVRVGGISLRAAGNGEPTEFLGGVTWEEFLKELQNLRKSHRKINHSNSTPQSR